MPEAMSYLSPDDLQQIPKDTRLRALPDAYAAWAKWFASDSAMVDMMSEFCGGRVCNEPVFVVDRAIGDGHTGPVGASPRYFGKSADLVIVDEFLDYEGIELRLLAQALERSAPVDQVFYRRFECPDDIFGLTKSAPTAFELKLEHELSRRRPKGRVELAYILFPVPALSRRINGPTLFPVSPAYEKIKNPGLDDGVTGFVSRTRY